MKKLLLATLLLALAASPALAFVQSAPLSSPSKPGAVPTGSHFTPAGQRLPDTGGSVGTGIWEPPAGSDDQSGVNPTHPVPEPGMMALASMGLLALGVAGRRRKKS